MYPLLTVSIATAPSFVDFLQWSRRRYSDGQEFKRTRLCLFFLWILYAITGHGWYFEPETTSLMEEWPWGNSAHRPNQLIAFPILYPLPMRIPIEPLQLFWWTPNPAALVYFILGWLFKWNAPLLYSPPLLVRSGYIPISGYGPGTTWREATGYGPGMGYWPGSRLL